MFNWGVNRIIYCGIPELSYYNTDFKVDCEKCINLFQEIHDFIEGFDNYKYEVEFWDGVKKQLTIKESYDIHPIYKENRGVHMYPLGKEIETLLKEKNINLEEIIKLDFFLEVLDRISYEYSPRYLEWAEELISELIDINKLREFSVSYKLLKHKNKIVKYIKALTVGEENPLVFKLAKEVSTSLYFKLREEYILKPYLVRGNGYYYGKSQDILFSSREYLYFLKLMDSKKSNMDEFKDYFTICYNYYRKSGYVDFFTLTQEDFKKAEKIGLIKP